MALDTYTNLQASVAKWLNRKDLADQIPDFIRLAEADMNRLLDCRQMVETMTVTLSGEDFYLPCDFAGVLSFRLNGLPTTRLDYVTPADLDACFGKGRPIRYTITDRIVLDPEPDGNYEARIRYRKRVPALSAANRCNWVLDKHPDAYLAGAVMNGFLYLEDDARAATWARKFSAAIDAINEDDKTQAFPAKVNAFGRTF